MRVFISQPMGGLTDEEVLKVRNETIMYLKDSFVFGKSVEFIDSFIPNTTEESNSLYLLGRALEKLAEADVCVFVDGWKNSRGCKIEHECCVQYNIERVYITKIKGE